ncbi:hypothetical protein [Paludibacterium denitrificans]|uniref:hypothetical protein n=1 Tax=Paludibacterium denitrificans TaxID=2675226 RepID=UPI001E4BDCB7|nr:hypothetical protein [Paludibacterium denitrificans]
MKKWWLMALLLASGMANAAIELGKDYVLLPQPQAVANPKKVEVIEFFSYHCIHCYELELSSDRMGEEAPGRCQLP